MKYSVRYRSITKPEHSVDGKRHEKWLYYCGIKEVPFRGKTISMTVWDKKAKRVIFDRKRDAMAFAKRQNAEVVEEK